MTAHRHRTKNEARGLSYARDARTARVQRLLRAWHGTAKTCARAPSHVPARSRETHSHSAIRNRKRPQMRTTPPAGHKRKNGLASAVPVLASCARRLAPFHTYAARPVNAPVKPGHGVVTPRGGAARLLGRRRQQPCGAVSSMHSFQSSPTTCHRTASAPAQSAKAPAAAAPHVAAGFPALVSCERFGAGALRSHHARRSTQKERPNLRSAPHRPPHAHAQRLVRSVASPPQIPRSPG